MCVLGEHLTLYCVYVCVCTHFIGYVWCVYIYASVCPRCTPHIF